MLVDKLQNIYDEWQINWKHTTENFPIDEHKSKQYAADKYAVELHELIPEIISNLTKKET